MKAIIIGSERGIRSMDSSKGYPMSLLQDRKGRRLIDWNLEALRENQINEVIYVGGYHIEKVVRLYSNLGFCYNPYWQSNLIHDTLNCVKAELDDELVIFSDRVVFLSSFLKTLESPVRQIEIWENNFTDENQGFRGLCRLPKQAALKLKTFLESNPKPSAISSLARLESICETTVVKKELGDEINVINSNRELTSFVLKGKAQTLERLRPLVKSATILDQFRFSEESWLENSQEIIDKLQAVFRAKKVVVRSSAASEDQSDQSLAGKFKSVLRVDAANDSDVCQAVEEVLASFTGQSDEVKPNEIFVQPLLEEVSMSGVMMTRDYHKGAPTYLINFDDSSRTTDSVTSGTGKSLRTFYVSHFSPLGCLQESFLRNLKKTAEELIELTGHDALDIEFAFDPQGQCFVFQVREIAGNASGQGIADHEIGEELNSLHENCKLLGQTESGLLGRATIWANMPDWNPAEIIGVHPAPLSSSLYHHIITEDVWAEARERIGYRNCSDFPLMKLLCGQPYVDVRTSLNSLLPASLPQEIGEKLIDHSINRLSSFPHLHDKYEFEVALTCLDFDYSSIAKRLLEDGFDEEECDEIKKHYLLLTNQIVKGTTQTISSLLTSSDELERRRIEVMSLPRKSAFEILKSIRRLLKDCKVYGTLPFSILARYSFVASSFLKSLVSKGQVSEKEVESVLSSIPTVAGSFTRDSAKCSAGELTNENFLARYGHLRPGTYDITSPSYQQSWSQLSALQNHSEASESKQDSESLAKAIASLREKVEPLLTENAFDFSYDEFFTFITHAIPAREQLKFEFTKNINSVFSCIRELGKLFELSDEDLSFLTIDELMAESWKSTSSIFARELKMKISHARKKQIVHGMTRLPGLIAKPDQIFCFELPKEVPNFVTTSCIQAPLQRLTAKVRDLPNLEGSIVAVENADPGFDWIFGAGIAGLVTQYGGAASHMAIRAAELQIPAAIGCGEMIFNKLNNAQFIELDCKGRQIRTIR
jgi:phosphohistidine swiveling domain-containing protein